GVEREKIRVVYNGVDERFQPGDKKRAREGLGLPHNRFTVLFVGLLVPIKGLEVLLEAVHQVDDERLLCILVGDGTLRECLEKQANETGLEGQVLFAGSRSSQEIPVWMNAADLLVLPSFSEGRPNVVLEAQACGLPVLATRVGGTPELVTDGSDGLLVDSGDTRQLADGIITLMSDESYRRQLGRGGRESIQKRGLTWEASALRIKEIYQEVRCQYSRR
ncbi:glycosyltransferase, partial [Candidatus Bathyarchaeota archaeon]|nr:glycosyltransferase [Candidatus Bathyarchaeota archaeon]